MEVRKNEKIKTKKKALVRWKNFKISDKGITLVALVITIALNAFAWS